MAVYRPSKLKITKDGSQDQYIFDLTSRVAVQQDVADAGKALGINSQGQVVPVPFSGNDFTGATESTAGVHGYVPAPAAGDQNKVLFGDGTWKDSGSAARLITITHSVVNESGPYSVTISDDRISPTMDCIYREIGDPRVFRAKPVVTCGNGSVTVSCADVVGETTLVMKFIKGTDESQVITSEEFDILDNRIKNVEDVYTTEHVIIESTDWTYQQDTGKYTYSWTNTKLTEKCGVDVWPEEGAEASGIMDFYADKVDVGSSSYAVLFETYEAATGDLPVAIRIINCKPDDLVDLTGAEIATNVISGATNVDEALTILNAGAINAENGLAYIVGNANTTGSTLAVGQFIYVKGHSTIDEGLRKVTASISANANITTSNTSACSEGGLNALNSKITDLYFPASASRTIIASNTTTGSGTANKDGWYVIYVSGDSHDCVVTINGQNIMSPTSSVRGYAILPLKKGTIVSFTVSGGTRYWEFASY